MSWIRVGMHSLGAENRKPPKLCKNTPTPFSLSLHHLLLRLTNSPSRALYASVLFHLPYPCLVESGSVFSASLTESFSLFPDRAEGPSWQCPLVFVVFLLRTMKRELCSPWSPMVYPITPLHPAHIHPVQTWAPPQPFSRHLLFPWCSFFYIQPSLPYSLQL